MGWTTCTAAWQILCRALFDKMPPAFYHARVSYSLGVAPLRWAASWLGLALLAGSLAILPLETAGWLAVAAGGAVGLLRWPWLIWPALAVALPVTSGIKPGRFSLTELLLALAVGLWFADGVRRRSVRVEPSPPFRLAAVYLLVVALAALRAPDLVEALAEVVKWAEFAIVLLLLPAVMAARQGRWLVAALVAGAAAQALLGLYQFANRIGPEWFVLFDRFMRASGSFSQPNPYAGYLGLTLPVAVSMALWAAQRTLAGRSADRWPAAGWLLFFSAGSLLITAGLIASWSRGGWLGALAGVAIVLLLRSRRVALLSGLVLLALLAALLVGALTPEAVPEPIAVRFREVPTALGFGNILSQPVNDDNFAVVERAAHWVAALRMWERAPWLGIGPGNYSVVYPAVRLPRWEEPLGHAHNVYLNVAAESGVIGLLAFTVLWAGMVVWLWQALQRARRGQCDDEHATWQVALIAGVLGVIGHLAVHSLVDNLFVQGMYLQVGLWLAVVFVGDWRGRRLGQE